MNEDILKGKWRQLKGKAKKIWGKITDDDLMVISGDRDKLAGILQTKYGYSKDKGVEEYKSFFQL